MIALPPLDARIPAWDREDLVARACPWCGGDGAPVAFVRPDGLEVRGCGACGTWYVSPAPSERQLDTFYARYDAEHRRDPATTPEALARDYRRTSPRADFRIRELASLRSLAGARVLDVGFGRARMLFDFLRLGAEPHGVELDAQAIDFARALGIGQVIRGTVADLPESARYDIVVLNDLIEHPLDPRALLDGAATRLAAGGLLALWTPNGDAIPRDPSPVTLRVDLEHMQYFTPAGIARIAAGLGLDLVHLETAGFPDLADIGRPRRLGPGGGARLRPILRGVPGLGAVHRVRRSLARPAGGDERDGAYGLFAILRRPG